jgi:hypothetical protein
MISGQILHNSSIVFPSFISLFMLTGLTYVIPHEIRINPIKETKYMSRPTAEFNKFLLLSGFISMPS